MKGLSLTQRTLRQLRQEGYICGIVERYLSHVGPFGIHQDLFGIFDIIAIKPKSICGVQSCSGSKFAVHDRKILDSEYSLEWLKAGGYIELWGWRKVKAKRGGKLMIWQPRLKTYSLKDFEDEKLK